MTVTFGIGFPPASFTVACSAVANAALICALCPEPCVAAMLAATAVIVVVSSLLADAEPPPDTST